MEKERLSVGDIIVVSTVLTGQREYPVKRIEGNKAITDFRVFNTLIYWGNTVYEYGIRGNYTTNGYWVKR